MANVSEKKRLVALLLCFFPTGLFVFLTQKQIVIVSIVMALVFFAFGGRIVDWIRAICEWF